MPPLGRVAADATLSVLVTSAVTPKTSAPSRSCPAVCGHPPGRELSSIDPATRYTWCNPHLALSPGAWMLRREACPSGGTGLATRVPRERARAVGR